LVPSRALFSQFLFLVSIFFLIPFKFIFLLIFIFYYLVFFIYCFLNVQNCPKIVCKPAQHRLSCTFTPLVAKTHTLGGQGSPFINTTGLHSKKRGGSHNQQKPAKFHKQKTNSSQGTYTRQYSLNHNQTSQQPQISPIKRACKPFHNIVLGPIFNHNTAVTNHHKS